MNQSKFNLNDLYPASRICLFSQRNIGKLVSRCGNYEFEDVISKIDNVDIIFPEPFAFLGKMLESSDTNHSRLNVANKGANLLARYLPGTSKCSGMRKVIINKKYELFLAFFQFPRDIININAIQGWKKNCRYSVCWLDEIWKNDVDIWRNQLKMLSNFDYVILNHYNSIKDVQAIINRPCLYMSPGIDMIRFCPYPNPPERVIDIYNMGRRVETTHVNLINISKKDNMFYIYDTINRMETDNHKYHRDLFANIIKRSRYFLVNIAKGYENTETMGQVEIGFRYYEGAGGGAIMIGDTPDTEYFKMEFDWTDVVIKLNNNWNNLVEIIRTIDSDPFRQETIRKNNIIQSLLRHDWSYRWKFILKLVNMEPAPAVEAREKKLKELAKLVENS